MATPETNKAEKQALDLFLTGEDAATYTQPAQSAEDMVNRGLVTPDGAATSKGQLFLQLRDRGLIQPDGQFTERGWAYAMPVAETLKPENIWAYKVREGDGLSDSDASFADMAGAVAEFGYDAGAGLLKTAWAYNKPLSAETIAERTVATVGAVEGATNATEELLAMAGRGSSIVGNALGSMIGMEKEADDYWWNAKQNAARVQHENQTAKIGETFEDYTGVATAADMVAQARAVLPKEEFDALSKQTTAFGNLLDPTVLIPAGVATKAGKVGIITRAGIKADATLAKAATLDLALARGAEELAKAESLAIKGRNASDLATKMGDQFAAQADPVKATRAREIAFRTSREAEEAANQAKRIPMEMESLAAQRQALQIPETAAQITQKALQVGNAVKTAPIRAASAASEAMGRGLIGVNDVLSGLAERSGLDAAYKLLGSKVGQAGAYFAVSPTLGTAAAILNSGPKLASVGKFGRVVGKQLSQARGQVPFWQRVTNYPDLSVAHRGIAHLADFMTAGGVVTGAVRSGARGIATSAPIDLTFNFLASGGEMDSQTLKQSLAQSLVFGGSTGALGGIMQAPMAKHKELALGDELNFRQSMTDVDQKTIYNAMPPGTRRAIATYAATNPQLQFNFTTQGPSNFSGNTATINVASGNPMKALIAHEVLHNVVIRNQMENGIGALMLGDGEAGGLLRSNDGTLDPNFKAFWDTYNSRMTREGLQEIDMNQAALEYYIDSSADYVAGMAESGELGAIGGRTEARRGITKLVEGTLSRIPLIRDLHFKLGGLMDDKGVMVQGNGLLADGIRQLPEVQRMTRDMLKNSSGRAQGQFKPIGTQRDSEGGVVIPVKKGDKPVIDKLVSIFETEEVNGQTRVKYDKDGDPIPLNPATDMARANISKVITEALSKRDKAAMPGKDEIHIAEDGEFVGTHLGADTIKAIADRKILNQEQLRILRNVNAAVKNFDGSRFTVINHPATKKIGKKVKYATLAPTLRDIVPVALIPTKQGNLLAGLMSVTQLEQNLTNRAASKRGKALYQGNRELMMTDVSAVMEMHRKDERTLPYFDEKYGAAKGEEYRNFINTVFGLMTPKQADINPLFNADKIGYKENVYKTYRIDRISQATKMTGDFVPMPFMYDSVKLNLMPNGEPTLDAAGNPVARP